MHKSKNSLVYKSYKEIKIDTEGVLKDFSIKGCRLKVSLIKKAKQSTNPLRSGLD